MTTATAHLTTLLNSLANRAQIGDTTDFGAAVGLVNDLNRLIIAGREADIRQAQAALSAVREQLRDEDADNPAEMLTGPNSRSFLAGALWAVSEMMTTRLATMPSSLALGRATRSARVKEMVLEAFASEAPQSPTAILDSIVKRDPATRLDEVSRAVTEMMAAGLVEPVSRAQGTDRRMKHFVLTLRGRSAAAQYVQMA
jgi:hypothetical protein